MESFGAWGNRVRGAPSSGEGPHATHPAVSADAMVASRDVPNRGPIQAATRWEARPTTCRCVRSTEARGGRTFAASFDRYMFSLHDRIEDSVGTSAWSACLPFTPSQAGISAAKPRLLEFTREPDFEFQTAFTVASHQRR